MKNHNLINKINLYMKVKQSLLLLIFLCILTSVSYSQIIPITSNGPLKLGQSVVTSYEVAGGPYNVVRVIDIRNRPPFITGGSELHPNQFAGPNWTNTKIGNVFGIALDDNPNPNIFLARSTVYCSASNGPAVPDSAIIYRLDGGNWGVSTYVKFRNISGPPQANVNWIPNTGSGLGNLCYDKWHQQIFVTNYEDGTIYRVKDITGIGQVVSWYDPSTGPFASDDGMNGFAPLGERLWGIGVFGTSANNVRVYFSRWRFDKARLPGSPVQFNEIWSIALNANGEFITSSLTREIEIPYLGNSSTNNYSNPVSDIEFSFNGDMLIGERTMSGDMGVCLPSTSWAHNSRILEYTRGANGLYSNYVIHNVGLLFLNPAPTNSCGGVDFEYGNTDSLTNENSLCDSIIVGTGDWLFGNSNPNRVYGLQETKRSSGNAPNASFSHYIDIDGSLGTEDKNKSGDVDVYRKDLCGDTSCISIVNDTTYCDSSGTYFYEFTVHNNSPTRTVEQLEITVDSPHPPNYVVTVPSTLNVTIGPSGTSAVQRVRMIGPGAVARTEVCYTLSAQYMHDDCPWCCYIENCIKLPDCGSCVQVLSDSLYCSNNSYFYNFLLQNGTIYDVTKIQITSPGVDPVTFIPQIIHFATPIAPGQVFPNETVQVLGGVAGMTIPIRIKLFSDDFECCYIELSKTFSNCDSSTVIIQSNELKVDNYNLGQNYPNPFNPTTFISFAVPVESIVELNVYDISGRLIQNLINNVKYAQGIYSVKFDGSKLSSGMYYYRLKTNDYIATRKMVLIK